MVVSNNNKRVFIELSEEEANDLWSILNKYINTPATHGDEFVTELMEKIDLVT